MTRIRALATGEYYHVFNRGAHRTNIAQDKADWMRLLFLFLYAQSPHSIKNSGRTIRQGDATAGFPVSLKEQEEIIANRLVDVIAFCIMPNHFHMLLKEETEGGIARYMQRMQISYTTYFNAKYDASGHVFQGRYKAIHVKDDRQLMHLSAYIHRNPHELKAWRGKEEAYPWSSLQDYVTANRWGGLLATDIIASHFGGTPDSNYRDFVRTSTAKTLAEELRGFSL